MIDLTGNWIDAETNDKIQVYIDHIQGVYRLYFSFIGKESILFPVSNDGERFPGIYGGNVQGLCNEDCTFFESLPIGQLDILFKKDEFFEFRFKNGILYKRFIFYSSDTPENNFKFSKINSHAVLISRELFKLFENNRSSQSDLDILKNILISRYQSDILLSNLANSNKEAVTDLQSLLLTVLNMEFPECREMEILALYYYYGLDELSQLGHKDSISELINLKKIMVKASENGLEEIDGLIISFKSGLLHKSENFETILEKLNWSN